MTGGRRVSESEQVVLPVSRVRHTVDLLDELVAAGLLTSDDAASVVQGVRTRARCVPSDDGAGRER